MANGIWYGIVNDSVSRSALKNVLIRVTDPDTDDLLGLYKDREGTLPLGNPFLTREDGAIQFYVRAGRINVNAVKGNDEVDFLDEIVVDDWGGCSCGTSFATVLGIQPTDSSNLGVILDGGSDLGPAGTIFVMTLVFTSEETEYSLFEDNTDLQLVVREGRLVVFKGATNGPGEDALTMYLNGAAPDGDGDDEFNGYLMPWENLAVGSCTVQIVASGSGSGFLETISAPSTCEFSAGFAAVYSDGGMSTPSLPGFDDWATASAGQLGVYASEGYAESGQTLSVGVGSDTIYGALIALRSGNAEPPPIPVSDYMVVGSSASPYLLQYDSDYELFGNFSNDHSAGPLGMAHAKDADDNYFLVNVFASGVRAELLRLFEGGYSATEDPDVLPSSNATSAAFHPSGALWAASGPADGPYIYVIDIVDLGSGNITSTRTAQPPGISDGRGAVAFSPDGKFFACGSNDSNKLYAWAAPGGTQLTDHAPDDWVAQTISVQPSIVVRGMAFSPDSSRLAVLCANSPYLLVYNTSDWSKRTDPSTLPTSSSTTSNVQIAWSPDGQFLAIPTRTASNATVVYQASDMSVVATLSSPTGIYAGVAFSADSSVLAIAHANSPRLSRFDTATWTSMGALTDSPSGAGTSVLFIKIPD